MDRTEEFASLLKVYGYTDWGHREDAMQPLHNPEFANIASGVANSIRNNESLLKRIDKLTSRKEFSNDPTSELNELSQMFQLKLVSMKRDMEILKTKSSMRNMSGNHQLHNNYIMTSLQKRISGHIELFQNSMKAHAEHVEKRSTRVHKYGQGTSEQVLAVASGMAAPSSVNSSSTSGSAPYAMFTSGIGEVRRRNRGAIAATSGAGTNGSATGTRSETENAVGTANTTINSLGNHARWKPTPSPPTSGAGSGGSDKKGNSQQSKGMAVTHITSSPYDNPVLGDDSAAMKHSRLKDGRNRQQAAQKVEQSIAQMGKLFSQMSTLVMQQSEVITRIEDDVEAGLAETTEAHESMVYFYEITKGNRALIVKVFALLVFFIVLFLYLT